MASNQAIHPAPEVPEGPEDEPALCEGEPEHAPHGVAASREVAFEDQAISQAAAFLHDDPDGVRSIFEAVDRLPDDPEPAESLPFGTAGLRRLRVGRYRVLYRVADDQIQVGHIGRIPAN